VHAEVKALIPLMPCLGGREVTVRPLEGGLTNRNYCIDCGSDRFVLRIMGETTLLQHYFGKARPADLRRLRLMRLASDMREAMWGFMQLGVSKLDFDYRTYARCHLQCFLEGAGREFRWD
jgi:hypothetical protein